jgi:hypothetical protein
MYLFFTLLIATHVFAGELRSGGPGTSSQRSQSESKNCLATFKKIIEEQSQDGFFISNRTKLCRSLVSDKNQFQTAAELKKQFDSDDQYKMHRLNQKELKSQKSLPGFFVNLRHGPNIAERETK